MSAKSEALQVLINRAQEEARGDAGTGAQPFAGTFGSPHTDRLVEAITSSDAIYYLAAKEAK